MNEDKKNTSNTFNGLKYFEIQCTIFLQGKQIMLDLL